MPTPRNREEAINTQLAVLISGLGVTADGETIHVHGKHRPDVIFQLRGLRVVIEAKFADHPNYESVVVEDARKRVRAGIAHIAASVIYPRTLRTTPTAKIIEVLERSRLKYKIVAETYETPDWHEGDPASLMDALRRTQETLTEDDIVEKTAKSLSEKLEVIAHQWVGQQGACDRLSQILGIIPPRGEKPEQAEARRETAAKVSALVLANAFIFQEQLAAADERVNPLRKLEGERDILTETAQHWKWIWQNINYVPIFQIGGSVLEELPISQPTLRAVRSLLTEAGAICSQQAALRHDLMGRIYHWLLHHGKYLGTYYTSVSAATLLLKLTLASDWKQDFGDPRALADFKVGDLACGTGTLLMAAAQSISDVYIRTRAETGRALDPVALRTLHGALMENVLCGYDVLPSAVHLTASTLAMLAPEVAFRNMNLYVMPMGFDHNTAKLGSLDFLIDKRVNTQMALDYTHVETIRTGAAESQAATAEIPELHLCVMNPPFVRSVGGNLLFGSLPDERGKLQDELKKRVKKIDASITAGLGSVFVALADRWMAEGGRLAFVLPAALASGEAWAETRKLIAGRYCLETVVSSHDASRPNFSENTSLSEILFIARKLGQEEKPEHTKYVNLWRNPRSIHEALDLANRITNTDNAASVEGKGITTLNSSTIKLGEIIHAPPAEGTGNWTGALFAQTELFRIFWKLQNGRLHLPREKAVVNLPLCRLDELGDLGPDRKRIHEGFNVSKDDWSSFPGFWGHKSDHVTTIAQSPNCHLLVWADSPRGPEYGPHLWKRAGSILLAERLRTNTHRVLAVGFEEDVLGNTWWALKTQKLTEEQEKALLLYLNCSLAIALYYGRRVITEGAFMQMKQPAWASMSALDVRSLKKTPLNALAMAYEEIGKEKLAPLAQLNTDDVRIRIDAEISNVLGLGDLKPVRELLAREPGLSGEEIGG